MQKRHAEIFFITGLFFLLFTLPVFASFKDVPKKHAYKEAIEYVQAENIVSGYPDGSYQPDRILNRAEFTKIIIGSRFSAQEIDSCLSTPDFYEQKLFSDVEKEAWFEKYVCMAKKEGIIGGYPDGTFKPENTINFAEASKITVKSYGLKTSGEEEPWFAPFLNKLEERNAIPRTLKAVSDLTARGGRQLTRGEMADIIFRLRDNKDSVVSEDGSFALHIAETALPDGIARDQIRVIKTEPDESTLQKVNGAPMIFYKLEPDGIQFKEPVTFQISAEVKDNSIPLVFLESGSSFDLIQEPMIVLDSSTQTVLLTAQISHFSGLAIVIKDSPFTISMDKIPNQFVKKPFDVKVIIERKELISMYESLSFLSWNLQEGQFAVLPHSVLFPKKHDDAPKEAPLNQVFEISKPFTCTKKRSEEWIYYQVRLQSQEYKNSLESNEMTYSYTPKITITSNIFPCQETPNLKEISSTLGEPKDISQSDAFGFFKVTLEAPSSAYIGVPFTSTVKIEKIKNKTFKRTVPSLAARWWNVGFDVEETHSALSWAASGTFFPDPQKLFPGEIKDPEKPVKKYADEYVVTGNAEYTCKEAGNASLTYIAPISYLRLIVSEMPVRKTQNFVDSEENITVSTVVDCKVPVEETPDNLQKPPEEKISLPIKTEEIIENECSYNKISLVDELSYFIETRGSETRISLFGILEFPIKGFLQADGSFYAEGYGKIGEWDLVQTQIIGNYNLSTKKLDYIENTYGKDGSLSDLCPFIIRYNF